MSTTPPPDDLQFATAEPGKGYTPDADAAMQCADCQRPITQYYFEAGGRVVCGACKGKIEGAMAGEGTSRAGRIARAVTFGFAAAVLGAIIWFTVAVVTGFEIGIVAIVIGFLVGAAVRKGSANRGGRRYQVAAALLTYLSVAMSYGALGIREIVTGPRTEAIADSTAAADTAAAGAAGAEADDEDEDEASAVASDTATATGTASNAQPGGGGIAVAIALMLGLMFVLPVLANVTALPGGIIGLAILAFGIHKAWQMNAAEPLQINGPFRVGGDGAGAAPAAG